MVAPWTDETTAQFLEAAADDLQRQVGAAGVVHEVTAHPSTGGSVTLVAGIGIGQRSYLIDGSGENLIAAYADLRRNEPELVLAAAYRELAQDLR
jgi:hypothetical protein